MLFFKILTPQQKKLIIAVFLIWIFVGVLVITSHPSNKTPSINTSHRHELNVLLSEISLKTQVADTREERIIGLSQHDGLAFDEAMLFIFERPGYYPFWMKDMNFPIDIFWLDENKHIIFIKEEAQPEDFPTSYISYEPALYAIETIAGFAQHYGVKRGDIVFW